VIFVWLFGITFLLGPAVGAAHALNSGFSILETTLVISTIHVILVPVWFAVFRYLKYEFHQRRYFVRELVGKMKITKNLEKTLDKTLVDFRRRLKRWSLGIAVFGLTFLFGVSWAALIAILLKIERTAIVLSVAAGAVASSVFWTLALAGLVGFLPEPWMLYLVLGMVTLAMLTHGKLYERKMLREVSKSVKKLTLEMEEYPVMGKPEKK
jgi:hypothetical protein